MIARILSWLGIDAATGWFLLVVLAGLGGYAQGHAYASAQGEARHNDYVAQQNQATATALVNHMRALQVEQERGDELSLALLASHAERAKLSDDLKKRVPHVSTVYIEKPGAAPVPLPDRPFTVGWVRDYNAALGLRMPEAPAATGSVARTSPELSSSGPFGGADAADLTRSTVSQADVLTAHHDNAAICRKIEAQLNAILDLDEGKSP
ncbi:hypothetical protein RAS12_12125 [Achromobacter seleniivolatilans]|uniref:Uncharacterized protein n=1 Tax=Achromobacter seleniivolatilans TaxID=3047478 RepID=A0ABY9M8R4_9BURK|nr:hypothetical protein [Achromobacter sp. R39]WMD23085.1 hypothetical protein RAS12_12125 [Achromobacter sp. R39]